MISLIALNLAQIASAPIYIAYSDPVTHERGLSVITSGAINDNDTITTAIKNGALIGWSGAGRISPDDDALIIQMLKEGYPSKYPDEY
ncbi:MAG: hypothetical protein H7222_06530 [Methylotenera sp.]|nr:hypothetical protein [Oligoflexia bacterium]